MYSTWCPVDKARQEPLSFSRHTTPSSGRSTQDDGLLSRRQSPSWLPVDVFHTWPQQSVGNHGCTASAEHFSGYAQSLSDKRGSMTGCEKGNAEAVIDWSDDHVINSHDDDVNDALSTLRNINFSESLFWNSGTAKSTNQLVLQTDVAATNAASPRSAAVVSTYRTGAVRCWVMRWTSRVPSCSSSTQSRVRRRCVSPRSRRHSTGDCEIGISALRWLGSENSFECSRIKVADSRVRLCATVYGRVIARYTDSFIR